MLGLYSKGSPWWSLITGYLRLVDLRRQVPMVETSLVQDKARLTTFRGFPNSDHFWDGLEAVQNI